VEYEAGTTGAEVVTGPAVELTGADGAMVAQVGMAVIRAPLLGISPAQIPRTYEAAWDCSSHEEPQQEIHSITSLMNCSLLQ